MNHSEEIVDQFTRQAEQFAGSPAARNEEILEGIRRMAQPRPSETLLDVACGPGVLVCGLAGSVRRATGIDLTPAMLDQARKTQREHGSTNVSWDQGDVTALPYPNASFDIVTCRFAFHHFSDPLQVLREMHRVCSPRGRVVVADTAPAADKADTFNAMERMRDPSHTRAMPAEELAALFGKAALPEPRIERMRLMLDLDSFLSRSYPREGDEARVRALFERSLTEDVLGLAPRREQGQIVFGLPVAILASQVPNGL
jgi:ubiquinone/menaquinone biosynthesis C-methylase UbiE